MLPAYFQVYIINIQKNSTAVYRCSPMMSSPSSLGSLIYVQCQGTIAAVSIAFYQALSSAVSGSVALLCVYSIRVNTYLTAMSPYPICPSSVGFISKPGKTILSYWGSRISVESSSILHVNVIDPRTGNEDNLW